jgi:hypothetical protein
MSAARRSMMPRRWGRDSEPINKDYASAFRDLASRRGASNEEAKASGKMGSIRSLEQRPGSATKANDTRANKGSGRGSKKADESERARGGSVRYRHALNVAPHSVISPKGEEEPMGKEKEFDPGHYMPWRTTDEDDPPRLMTDAEMKDCFDLPPQLDRGDAQIIDKSLSLTIPTMSAVTPR